MHATCVAIDECGILLSGPPASGKSDLALRLIDEGAVLVSDDQTHLISEVDSKTGKESIMAFPPHSIEGLIEVRHIGLMKFPFRPRVRIALHIMLSPLEDKTERLPEEEWMAIFGQKIRSIKLPAYAASTTAKIRTLLRFPLITDQL